MRRIYFALDQLPVAERVAWTLQKLENESLETIARIQGKWRERRRYLASLRRLARENKKPYWVAVALIREGRVRRAWLGIGGETMPLPRRYVRHFDLVRETGVRVQSAEAKSPATVAGIERGDVIVEVDGIAIANVDDLQRSLGADAIGRELSVVVLRRDRKITLGVIPVERASVR